MAPKKKKKGYESNIGGGSPQGVYKPKDWEKEINNPNKKIQAKTNKNRSKLLAHGEYFDDYGRIKRKPRGLTPSGKPFDMPVDKEQQKKNKKKHNRLYHGIG